MSNNQSIQKIFNQYQIKLSIILDSINIQIQKQNSFYIYKNNFNIEYLQQQKLLMENYTIEEYEIKYLVNEKDERHLLLLLYLLLLIGKIII